MIEIKQLTEITPNHLREIMAGYTTSAVYRVTKNESDTTTVISLSLMDLKQPYVKEWETNDEEIGYYRKLLEDGLSLGVYDGNNLVGIAIVEKKAWNRTLWVWEFHVRPDYQNRGIGAQLMNHLVDIGREAGCRVLVCETQNTNVSAIRFYRKVGFEVGAVDLSYYTNTDMTDFEVAVFMKKYIE